MEDPKHLFELCEVGPSHEDDQTCVWKFAIKCFHFLEQVHWLGKPVFCLPQVSIFLSTSQQDPACFDVPVEADICHRASERLVL